MRLSINGETREVADQVDVAGLLAMLGAPAEGVAVAVNGEVVPRGERDRLLAEGDRVEVIRAVGGG